MRSLERGAWSGLIATGQMTFFLFLAFDYLQRREKSPLPPAKLTDDVFHGANLRAQTPARRERASLVSHFLFGLFGAVVYSRARSAEPLRRMPALLSGTLFGITVWASAYLAGIPALGFRPSAYRMPARRNLMMFLAHLVWGATLGKTEASLAKQDEEMLDGARRKAAG
jgi:uncharacterized membrane protein YagU involved in acid resistance